MTAPLRYPLRRAFSLVEILVVISIIGVLAAIAIPAVTGLTSSAKDVEADDFTESLNRAVRNFAQSNWEIPTAANNGATTDEFIVLRSLQHRWGNTGTIGSPYKAGSPYFSPKYNPATSSDSTTYRLRWNGRTFEMLRPGTAGSGFLKTFEGRDYTAADYVSPSGYKPAGML